MTWPSHRQLRRSLSRRHHPPRRLGRCRRCRRRCASPWFGPLAPHKPVCEMLPSRRASRILALRPLRPPSPLAIPTSRLFTHHSQLLLVAANRPPRPQLPYLSQPRLRPLNHPPARLLSTETEAHIKQQLWLAGKYTVLGWTIFFLGCIAYAGFQMEWEERKNPTPSEWNWRVRASFRNARSQLSQDWAITHGFIDWAVAADQLREVLWRLESPEHDGRGIETVSTGPDQQDLLLSVTRQIGKKVFDVSNKSWEWRSGYHETVMALGKAAEHLEHHVRDTLQRRAFPKSMVVGPSNPDPRPTPSYMGDTPLEENCVRCLEEPDIFYMRIVTGVGFTTKQKMEAASAYANWLDIKGLKGSAEEAYKWEVDIAKGALSATVDPDTVIDSKTGVLKASDDAIREVTPNLLRATTDMAIHSARNGDVSAALPMFLSVLRLRRSAPVSPFPPLEEKKPERSWLSSLGATPFPAPPLSGDVPFIRHSDKPTCEDSELMLYIGEILFATSPKSDEGMGWTRQAVTIAEANMAGSASGPELVKCRECFLTGVNNWDAMLQRAGAKLEAEPPKKGWFGFGGNKDQLEEKAWDFAEQQREVELLKERIAREGIALAVARASNSNPSGLWIS